MSKVIEVKFKGQQGAEELYIGTGLTKKVYVRQPLPGEERVVWLTATKTEAGYEASSPIKAGTVIRVVAGVKKEKTVIYEEIMEADETGADPSAERVEHFACDQLKATAKNLVKELGLHSYDSWAKWLLNERTRFGYTGYPDNWLHYGTTPVTTREHECVAIIGVPYKIVATEWRHMICGKNWVVYELKDTHGNVMELCGYQFAP